VTGILTININIRSFTFSHSTVFHLVVANVDFLVLITNATTAVDILNIIFFRAAEEKKVSAVLWQFFPDFSIY